MFKLRLLLAPPFLKRMVWLSVESLSLFPWIVESLILYCGVDSFSRLWSDVISLPIRYIQSNGITSSLSHDSIVTGLLEVPSSW